jgi:hypothetical protein
MDEWMGTLLLFQLSRYILKVLSNSTTIFPIALNFKRQQNFFDRLNLMIEKADLQRSMPHGEGIRHQKLSKPYVILPFLLNDGVGAAYLPRTLSFPRLNV